MAWGKKRVTLQDIEEEVGFSELAGRYRMPGVLSFLGLLSTIMFLIFLVDWIRGGLPGGVAAITAGIAAGFTCLDFAWNWLTGRLGMRKYLMDPEGLIKVGWFGPRDWVLWSEVSGTKVVANSNLAGYRVSRIDLKRDDGSAFKIFLMGFLPRLPRDLDAAMKKAAVKQ